MMGVDAKDDAVVVEGGREVGNEDREGGNEGKRGVEDVLVGVIVVVVRNAVMGI